jgi:hypothetical protein
VQARRKGLDVEGDTGLELKGVEMDTVRIEHQMRDFDVWKAAFNRDPAGRQQQQSGVRRFWILRPSDEAAT